MGVGGGCEGEGSLPWVYSASSRTDPARPIYWCRAQSPDVGPANMADSYGSSLSDLTESRPGQAVICEWSHQSISVADLGGGRLGGLSLPRGV